MSVRKLNVLTCQLGESLDQPGFRHAAAPIGGRIGGKRLGAGLYEAVAEHPIWPYHYHYATEEWLYVISGAPVLRDGSGRRALQPGDMVCFPPNHTGVHTVYGPGRFIIFSTQETPGPWISVYPDSDKLGISPGTRETSALNVLRLPRSGAVDYWFGEGGSAATGSVTVEREPATAPGGPEINALTVPLDDAPEDAPAGSRFRAASVGPGSDRGGLRATAVELDPGEGSPPYHYQYGREEWVLVLSGTPILRHPDGEDVLQTGDIVCFPEGPGGAHRLINQGGDIVRALLLCTQGLPANVCFPDTRTWTLVHGPDAPEVTLREPGAVKDRRR